MALLALDGTTVGITADRRAAEQAQMFTQRGAKVVHGPVLTTAPLDDQEQARATTLDLLSEPVDALVANTAIGIRTWMAMADGWGVTEQLVDALARSYVAARGPKAAGALLAVDVPVHWRSPSSMLAEVVDHLIDRGVAGRRVALQLDGGGDGDEARRLRAAGAEVIELRSYRYSWPKNTAPALRLIDAACDRRIDVVTFTAAPAVRHLFDLAEGNGKLGELSAAFGDGVVAMCVGPVCRQAAIERGVSSALQPAMARLGGMVKAVVDEMHRRRRTIRVDDIEAAVQGSLISVGPMSVSLPKRERDVFDVLSRRPGVVVPRRALLSEIWGSVATDPHTLEATVGRLRRRLGQTGLTVEAIHRRGYRLTSGGD